MKLKDLHSDGLTGTKRLSRSSTARSLQSAHIKKSWRSTSFWFTWKGWSAWPNTRSPTRTAPGRLESLGAVIASESTWSSPTSTSAWQAPVSEPPPNHFLAPACRRLSKALWLARSSGSASSGSVAASSCRSPIAWSWRASLWSQISLFKLRDLLLP